MYQKQYNTDTRRYRNFMAINRHLKILLLAGNLWYFGEGMLGPMFAVFTERIGGDILDISWAWATYLIVSGVAYVIVGKFTDENNNKEKIMVWGYALNALFTFAYLLVSAPWHLFFVQIGLGLAAALATPTWYALYAKYENKKQDGYDWGLAGGMAHIVTGFATIVGGYIVSYFSFTLLFLIMGVIQIFATIYQAKILYRK